MVTVDAEALIGWILPRSSPGRPPQEEGGAAGPFRRSEHPPAGDASPGSSARAGRIGCVGTPGIAGHTNREALTGAEAVLAGLDDEQRAAAVAVRGPVCILAGAGTGKTRTITHRIAYGVHIGEYVPEQVLAVTFTARAAGGLRGRLAGPRVGGGPARALPPAPPRPPRHFPPPGPRGPPPGP